jgi:ankyrin repeat protein
MGILFSFTSEQEIIGDSLDTLLEIPDEEEIDWDAVVERLAASPEEASLYCHGAEPSPLLLALSRKKKPPTNVVQAFLDAYEDSVFHKDASGRNVLHEAVHDQIECAATTFLLLRLNSDSASQADESGMIPLHQSIRDEEAARLLLRSYPEGVCSREQHGKLPLHYAVDGDNTSPGVVRLFVKEGQKQNLGTNTDGGVLIRDRQGITPLKVLLDNIARNFKQDKISGKQLPLTVEGAQLWEALTFMVQTVFPKQQPFRLLHSVVELECPPVVVSYALSCHPEQALVRDDQGRTPLHIAASLPSISPEVIYGLVHSEYGHPMAARMTDSDGRLPIDLAAEHGRDYSDDVECLLKAEPRAVDTRDLREKMYPFMTAAMSESHNINTIYSLLRAKPHVLSYFNLE